MSSTTNFVDLESGPSNIISGTQLPMAQQPAHASTSNGGSPPLIRDAFLKFFGARPTDESRRDLRRVSTGDAPPPYHDTELPAYSVKADEEPMTLAKYFFKFGFVFPVFWLIGTFVLISPLSAPSDWHATKSQEDRQQLVKVTRAVEVKWAKRCLYALVALIAVAVMLGVSIWMMSKSDSGGRTASHH